VGESILVTTEFKYDVAITLLGADEPYARDLEAEISRVVRGDVFLYSRQAGELAVTGDLVDELSYPRKLWNGVELMG
jgi:hypothetical protein